MGACNLISRNDDDLVAVLREIRLSNPDLGRAKIIDRLQTEHHWCVSDTRLRKVLEKNNLLRPGQEPRPTKECDLPPIEYPKDALAAQQRYKDDSTRIFKIYSRGPYDFGVSPNSDMAIKIDLCHQRLKDFGRPKAQADRVELGSAWPLHCIFDFYWAAAQIAGVSKADIDSWRRSKYGVNPIPYLPKYTPAQIAAQKAAFEEKSMDLKREMLKLPEARPYIPVDAHGEPIWDEKINGEFCVVVVRIDKGSGLKEFGRVNPKP